MATYSFLEINANITGTNGSFSLSDGNTEGGISVAMRGPKNTLTVGADGSTQNSLHADRTATCTARFLKTSPTNALLQSMYDADEADVTSWGGNTITITDINRGDSITLTNVAFQKFPDNVYDKEGPALEWTFDCGFMHTTLG